MAVLRSKIVGEARQVPERLQSGVPVESLTGIPLESLLRLISMIRGLDCGPARMESLSPSAAEFFADWPHGFHAFLRRIAPESGGAIVQSVGLRRQFSKFYQTVFKSPVSLIGVEFIRDEFVRFGQMEWGEALVDRKLLRAEPSDQRFVSSTSLASSLGVMPVTVRRWIGQGSIPAKTVLLGRNKHYVADASVVDKIVRESGGRLDARAAGGFCHLPVSVLKELKRTGHYSANPIANCRTGYWPEDLTALSERLIAKGREACDGGDEEKVALGAILEFWKLGVPQAKGAFVAAVLDQQILPVGVEGSSVRHLLFRVLDVEKFRLQYAVDSGRDVVSATAAACILGTGVHVVAGLVASGHILRDAARRTGVSRDSVEQFLRVWHPLSAIAKDLRTSAAVLLELVKQLDLPLLQVPIRPGLSTPFVGSINVQALVNACRARVILKDSLKTDSV